MARDEVLSRLLDARPALDHEAAGPFLRALSADLPAGLDTVDEALLGGRLAGRVGLAFAAGYLPALRRLLGARASRRTCLAASEEGGAHPRAIRTELREEGGGMTLTGEKIWTTLAEEAADVVVFARAGERDGRPLLRAALIPLDRAGITLGRMPETPFAPEIAHGRLTLAAVSVRPEELLDGDAYDLYLKPFRTIEDVHVFAALVGHLVGVALAHGFDRAALARLTALALAVRGVGALDPTERATHVALEGVVLALDSIGRALASSFARAPDDVRARWERDQGLLRVASRARAERFARACEDLPPPREAPR